MEYNIVANDAAGINLYAWIEYASRTDGYIFTYIYLLAYMGIIADFAAFSYVSAFANLYFAAYFCTETDVTVTAPVTPYGILLVMIIVQK